MAFFGMRGTGDWATDQRPEEWRPGILYLYPNGSTPLTGILSMLRNERTFDPSFNWWTKTLPSQGEDITEIYDDVGLGTAYTASTAVVGTTLFVNVTDASQFRVGHQVMFRKTGDFRNDHRGKVTAVNTSGTNYVAVKMSEADDATYSLEEATRLLIIGNVNAEGAVTPDTITYDPVKYNNLTQIFRTPLSITRTARRTRLRTGDAYDEMLREALELHAIEMEKAMIWGLKTEVIGSNGKPERTTDGVATAIIANQPNNADSFVTNTDYSGQTWLGAGEEWLLDKLELPYRYGRDDKLALVGSKALTGINRLARTYGNIELVVRQRDFGIRVMEWVFEHGEMNLKKHPLFSHEVSMRNTLLLIEPAMLGTRYVDDTFFVDDPQDQRRRNLGLDGTEEEFITEIGLEYEHLETMGLFDGLNDDNTA